MLQTIHREVNYITESIALLLHLGMGKNYSSLLESLNKKYANPFQEGLKIFELLEKIEAYAQKAFVKDMDSIQYYFTPYREGSCRCAGKIALLWEEPENFTIQDFSELASFLQGLSEQEYCEAFGRCLHNLASDTWEDDPIPTKEPFDVISCLMDLEIDEQEKWKLQKIFFDRTLHQEKALSLLEKACGCLQEFSEELASLTGRFYDYWTAVFKHCSPTSYLHEMLEIDLGENPLGFHLYPSVISPNMVSMHIKIEDDGSYRQMDAYQFGILFGEEFDLRTSRAHTEEGYETYAAQAMKLLADKSKLEILSYIRDKEAYGSQLAKHLNLTTATISHHMNALLRAGLVEMKRIDKRIYYFSNKKALEEVLDYCKRLLL